MTLIDGAGHTRDENEWAYRRYLCEGICPNCHIALRRKGVTVAKCDCGLVWKSTRLPEIFPESNKSYKETQ